MTYNFVAYACLFIFPLSCMNGFRPRPQKLLPGVPRFAGGGGGSRVYSPLANFVRYFRVWLRGEAPWPKWSRIDKTPSA